MAKPILTRMTAKGFRSLADVSLPLSPFTVLVGPNGSGKSNVLNVLRFLASTVRFDLAAAVGEWGGFEYVKRQDGRSPGARVTLGIQGIVTKHASSNAPDEYRLSFRQTPREMLSREESFVFKRTQGQGRRITVKGRKVEIRRDDIDGALSSTRELASQQTTGLATLPDWSDSEGGEGIRLLAEFLSSIRVLEPDVDAARQPFRIVPGSLADDASNLAPELHRLSQRDPESFALLESEMCSCLSGLEAIEFQSIGGPGKAVVVVLRERGVRAPVELADASYGTVRLLAMLTALHEPDPPPFTAIEEADHGLHPYAIDVLVARMRAASERTQLLVTTHAPTFVNQLRPGELVICERDPESGASRIPHLPREKLQRIARNSELQLGELWYGGALGGVPD